MLESFLFFPPFASCQPIYFSSGPYTDRHTRACTHACTYTCNLQAAPYLFAVFYTFFLSPLLLVTPNFITSVLCYWFLQPLSVPPIIPSTPLDWPQSILSPLLDGSSYRTAFWDWLRLAQNFSAANSVKSKCLGLALKAPCALPLTLISGFSSCHFPTGMRRS